MNRRSSTTELFHVHEINWGMELNCALFVCVHCCALFVKLVLQKREYNLGSAAD